MPKLRHPRSNHTAFETECNGGKKGFDLRDFEHDKSKTERVRALVLFRVPVPPFAELAAELFARTVEHHPQVAFGDIEPPADLRVGSLLDGVELKYLRHAWRQLAEGEFEVGAEFGQLNSAAGRLRLRCDVVQPHHRVFPRLVITVRCRNLCTKRALTAGV